MVTGQIGNVIMDDIVDIDQTLKAVWDSSKTMGVRSWIWVDSATYLRIARRTLRKRQFRRWRGRFRAYCRSI